MEGTLLKLKQYYETFTKNEKKIADYIIDNLIEVKGLNTYDLAIRSQVSQASIVRFAKKLGFKGFPDLKIALAGDFQNLEKKNEILNIIYEEITMEDSMEILAKKVMFENINIIEDTYRILDFTEVEKAIILLERARKIYILGAGSSAVVAKDFQYKLWELGKNVLFDTDQHVQLSNASTATDEDVIFVISHSGHTLDIYNTLEEFKNKGVKIISLTKFASNPIKNIADVTLTTVSENRNFRSSSLSARIAQLTVIDILYVKLIQNNKEMAEKYIGNAMESVRKIKM